MKSTAPKRGPNARPVAFDHVDRGRTKSNTGGHANWVSVTKNRPKDQPFFFWFAALDTHRPWDSDDQWVADSYGPMHNPADVIMPPFLVDEPNTRQDLASYYNEVARFDHYVGLVVAELKKQRVLENTLILVMADNGRPFPRAKTRRHDSGLRTALVAHWPERIANTGETSSLVSAIDLAPTILELADCEILITMQGVSMTQLLNNTAASIRQYAFSEHNWHDYEAHGRSVRHRDFLRVRNSRTKLAWQGPADSVRSPSHQTLLKLQQQNQLSAAQRDVFLTPRPEVELYNTRLDPHQLTNLADDPQYASQRSDLDTVLTQWINETGDCVPVHLSPDEFNR